MRSRVARLNRTQPAPSARVQVNIGTCQYHFYDHARRNIALAPTTYIFLPNVGRIPPIRHLNCLIAVSALS
jgi:hypothetical protein